MNIELRDASNNQEFRDELASQGGKIKVPCLRIERDDDTTQWLYESTEIIKYLESKFSWGGFLWGGLRQECFGCQQAHPLGESDK